MNTFLQRSVGLGKKSVCAMLSAFLATSLAACTTVYEEPKLSSASASDKPVQSSELERANIRLQLGISYLQQNQIPTALKELNSAIALNPNLTDAYGVRALVYMQMHKNDLAEQDFLTVKQMAPNNPDYTNNYAWFLCMNGREKQAMDMFKQVISDPTYTQPIKALNNAGLCSLKLKDDVAAEKYFNESLRYDASNPTTNLNLARLSYKKSDLPRAKFYVNTLVKAEAFTPEILWLAIKINHHLNDPVEEASLSVQLKRRFPTSDEYALLERGAFNE